MSNMKSFITHVKTVCKAAGIKCDLRPAKWVRCGPKQQCSGYFDAENKVLVVAMKSPDSLGIVVHEYAHLTQWQDGIDLWKKADVSLVLLNDWLDGKPVKSINKHIDIARDLELDNERRSVAIIRKWNLNIDVDLYTKKANAYLQFYNWLKTSRRWSKAGKSPYNNPRILEAMSSKFNMNYRTMSRRVYAAFAAAEQANEI